MNVLNKTGIYKDYSQVLHSMGLIGSSMLCKHQSGFRQNHSAITAIVDVA